MNKPEPLDKDLYNQIKQEIYGKYPKHSIYRSMMLVKRYLDAGGEYANKKPSKSSTKKWLNERWLSANDWYHDKKKVKCGNSDTQKKYNEYPLCYKQSRLMKMTDNELRLLIGEKNKLGKRHLQTKELVGKGIVYQIPEIVDLKNVKKMARASGYDPKRIMAPTKKNAKLSYLTPDGRRINFGHSSYESYDRHRDELRRKLYLARATNMRGKWRDDPYSANNLSINLLWSPLVKL
jgi:hypothetical protein